jgi:hypothetical protein
MAELLQIVCDNCGAKYRLPESFQNATAKCKQCGSQIDVASQRKASALPVGAAAAPAIAAGARPAQQRRAEPARTPALRTAKSVRPDRQARRGSGRDQGDAPKGSSKLPFVLAGVGLLAVVIVVILMMNQGGGNPANKPAPAAAQPGKTGAPKEASGSKGDSKPVDAGKQPPK